MRERFFWVAKLLLLVLMTAYLPLLLVVTSFSRFLQSNLHAIELEHELAKAERRTRQGSKTR